MELYKMAPLLKHTVQIECITSYDDNVLLGTRQGHLFMYNLVKTADYKAEVQVMRYNKTFSKKPILQLDVIPEHNVLISLTDGIVQVHDINGFNFPTVFTLSKSKGATLFTINAQVVEDKTVYYMCVVVKRKLQLYKWVDREFVNYRDDINLIEVPKSIAWCEKTICVGYKGEYFCCLLDDKNTVIELFPTSSSRTSEPYIVKATDNTFSLVRDNQTVLIGNNGEAKNLKVLKWSDIPAALAWDDPYCIALVGDTVELQTIESGGIIQTIPEMPKVRFISCAGQGLIYAASISQLWVLQAIDIALQRNLLLEEKQFQLALTLTRGSRETEAEKKEIIYEIETRLAYDLFAKKKFTESMQAFLTLGTNPSDVIRLFPNLLPQQGKVETETPSNFTPRELEEGLQALVDYLTNVRYNIQREQQDRMKAEGNMNEVFISKSNQQLLQIIDTTLLKCYLQTNDALVAPLLRTNHCHLAEAERMLKKYGKDNELMILYQRKGQHRRALELLKSKENIEGTVRYLQHIGEKHIGLILEFADWVLEKAPSEGIKIFTEDLMDVEMLPRPRILDYLLRSHGNLVIEYLEHVIDIWGDTNPLFHNALIHKYKDKALSNDPGASVAAAKLLKFLETSEHYKADTILQHIVGHELIVERAVILGKMRRFEQSLAIFVRVLGDVDKAIDYCDKIYSKGYPEGRNIYVTLIQILLNPDAIDISMNDVVLSPKTAQPDLERALKILEEYASRINPLMILPVLPKTINVSRIYKYLQVALHENMKERIRVQLLDGLLYAEHLQLQELRLHLENQHVVITEFNICPVCKKRFGNQSALVRYPNGDVVHYSCQD